jgi:choice-of-anchor C domain-containing protein
MLSGLLNILLSAAANLPAPVLTALVPAFIAIAPILPPEVVQSVVIAIAPSLSPTVVETITTQLNLPPVQSGGSGDDTETGGAGTDLVTGGAGSDTVNGGAGSDVVNGGIGDDTAIYVAAENVGAHDQYAGDAGRDTLRLVLTHDEWTNAALQADIAAYQQFIAAHSNGGTTDADGATFQFTAFDLDATGFERLEVTVDGVAMDLADQAVTLQADAATTDEDSAGLLIDVLANDSVPDLVKTLALVTGPAKGTVSLTADNRFIYTPGAALQALNAGESTTDTFTYQVTDADGDTSTASVTVTIEGANDTPNQAPAIAHVTPDLIVNGSFELPVGGITLGGGSTAITGWVVTGNSVDYYDGWTPADGTHSIDLNGEHLGGIQQTFATIAGAQYTVTFGFAGNPDNQTPGQTVKHLQVSAAGTVQDYAFDTTGRTLTDMGWTEQTFTFTATDSSTTLHFRSHDNSGYGAVIDAVSVHQTSQATDAGMPLTISSLSVSDIDAGSNPLQISLTAGHGALSLANAAGLTMVDGNGSDGTLSFTGSLSAINSALAAGVTYAPGAGYQGPDALTMTVNDQGNTGSGGALTDSETISLVVNPPGGPGTPLVQNDGNGIAIDIGAFPFDPGRAGNVLANDSDPNGDTLSVSGFASAFDSGDPGETVEGLFGLLTVQANGAWSYVLDLLDPDTLAIGFGGGLTYDQFTYTAADGHGGFATAALEIAIHRSSMGPAE